MITLCYRAANPRSNASGIYPLLGTVVITNGGRRGLCRCCWLDESLLLLLLIAAAGCCWLLLLIAAAGCCCWLLLLVAAVDCCCWLLLLIAAVDCCCWLLLLIAAAGCCCWLLLLIAAVDCCCWLLLFIAAVDCWPESFWIFSGCWWFAAKTILQAKKSLNLFGCWWFAAKTNLQAKKSLNISRILVRWRWKRVSPGGSRVVGCSKRTNIMAVHWVFILVWSRAEREPIGSFGEKLRASRSAL